MGGDEGVRVMMAGVALARHRHEGLRFTLFGDETRIKSALDNHPNLRAASEVVHASDVVDAGDKPSVAIRKKASSMSMAIAAVKAGEAGAAVSSGNTGALMAMAKLALRTMPGIDRPALAALLPTLGDNDVVMLDLGANTECDARNLVQFAVMGAAYARIALDLDRPRVRLMNIGTEEMKGTDNIRDAAAELRAAKHLRLDFQGFIEGNKLARGDQPALLLRRLHRRRQDRQRRRRRHRQRRIFRQCRAQDGGGHRPFRHRRIAQSLYQFDPLEDRFPDLEAGDASAQASSRSQQS